MFNNISKYTLNIEKSKDYFNYVKAFKNIKN